MIDFRALCAELVAIEDALSGGSVQFSNQSQALDGYSALATFRNVAARARAALAQPEPVAPTLMEIVALADEIEEEGLGQVDLVRRALSCWGRPAIEPVPVSERPWDRNGWCDENGWCWGFDANDSDTYWVFDDPASCPCWTHLLPHHALPVPQQEVQ